jgi:hypothetical protein
MRFAIVLTISLFFFTPYIARPQCAAGNALGAGGITAAMEIAQTFEMDCIGDGSFTSLTVFNTSSATNVTLEILNGAYGSAVQYTQTIPVLGVANPLQNIILLEGGTGSLAYKSGNVYTFVLTSDGGAPLAFSKSTMMDSYQDGLLYEGGTLVPGHDLFFTMSGVMSVLPVELSKFEATYQSDRTELRWETSFEENNRGFEIERSQDLRNWSKIGFVEGENDRQGATYRFTDALIFENGLFYYRLKQVDWDGQFEYSSVLTIQAKGIRQPPVATAFPNPASAGGQVGLKQLENEEVLQLSLLNQNGQLITKGSTTPLAIPADIPAGIYLLKIDYTRASTEVTRLVIR